MKRVSTSLAFILGTLVSFTSAAQIQGFVSGYAPGDVDEKKEAKGKETTKKLHADFMWGLGAEFLANPVGPLMVGGGLGFFSVQQDGGEYVVMSSIPVWASLGLIGPEQWSVRPYLEARVGYPIPAATLMTWWDKPYNFFVTGTVGVQLPYHVGVEFDCTYLTMDKYFAKYNVDFRLTSLKIGGSITVHFDLSGKSSEPGETFKKSDFVVQGAVEESSSAEPLVDANEEQPAASEEQTFSDYSSQPAEEPAVQENADIPNAVESQEQPEEESGEPSAEEASAEESASDDAAPEEVSAEDTQSDEADDSASAEEVAAEEAPAESAVEEPASEPAVEKTAQKASVKKNTKKSKSKKASKKSKKSSKKSAKKKSAKKKR